MRLETSSCVLKNIWHYILIYFYCLLEFMPIPWFEKGLIYTSIQYFVKCMHDTCLLLACVLTFHSLIGTFWKIEVLNFNMVPFIYLLSVILFVSCLRDSCILLDYEDIVFSSKILLFCLLFVYESSWIFYATWGWNQINWFFIWMSN